MPPRLPQPALNLVKRLARRAPYLQELFAQRDQLRQDVVRLEAALAAQQELVRQRDQLVTEVQRLGARVEQLTPPEGRREAYAHWGEDQIVAWLFEKRMQGFYVDIGAYHPNLYSNTRLLYGRGWRGLNVDCNPYMLALYGQLRPGDINVQAAVARSEGAAKYYVFHEWASSNTLSKEFAEAICRSQGITVKEVLDVPCLPLRTLFERHVPAGQCIDFLNVDVESVDLEVLESNDWSTYRPLVVAIEDLDFELEAPERSPIYRFLRGQGYKCISRSIFTNFFVDEQRRDQLDRCPDLVAAEVRTTT